MLFFWNSLAFSVILQMLAIWSLFPLPFLNSASTFGSSQYTYCWSLAWRVLSITWLSNYFVNWHHQLDGPEFEQALRVGDGQGSLVCCSPWVAKSQTWPSAQIVLTFLTTLISSVHFFLIIIPFEIFLVFGMTIHFYWKPRYLMYCVIRHWVLFKSSLIVGFLWYHLLWKGGEHCYIVSYANRHSVSLSSLFDTPGYEWLLE